MKKILDFGCGKGDFYKFIKDRGIVSRYCGIDINENLIELARNKYPETEFMAMDIDESEIDRQFDIVFVCGVFNLRIAGIEESMKAVLKKLFGLSREAMHVNLLTHYIPQRNIELFYVKPEEILEFVIGELSPAVTLRHVQEDIFLSIYRS